MKRFVLRVALLGMIVAILLFIVFTVGDSLAARVYGPNTKTQIEESFQNALTSCTTNWILGNSRVYRGLNPDEMSKSWYNFAHDNDSYNQMYYKLEFLLNNGCIIDTLIIGTDYFQFGVYSDTRNYVYDNLLGEDYIKDYNNCWLKEEFDNIKRVFITKQGSFLSLLLHAKALMGGGKPLPYLRKNGQYINDRGIAKEGDYTKRASVMLDIQKRYYEKILALGKSHNIELYVLMMPVRDNELSSYEDSYIIKFKDYIEQTLKAAGYENRFIDMSNNPDFKDYKMYTDITHFNSESADRYTKCFYEKLKSIN